MRTATIVVIERHAMNQNIEDFLVNECDLELNGDTFDGIEFSAYTSSKTLQEIGCLIEDNFDLDGEITNEEVEFFDVITRKQILKMG